METYTEEDVLCIAENLIDLRRLELRGEQMLASLIDSIKLVDESDEIDLQEYWEAASNLRMANAEIHEEIEATMKRARAIPGLEDAILNKVAALVSANATVLAELQRCAA